MKISSLSFSGIPTDFELEKEPVHDNLRRDFKCIMHLGGRGLLFPTPPTLGQP